MVTQLNLSQLSEIGALELSHKLNLQQVILIDVRESSEYAGEHITGSISLPLSTFEPNQVAQFGDQSLVLCCQSGMRSSRASQQLLNCGFNNISQLKGGLSSWKAAGFKTNTTQSAPISLFRQVQIVAGSLVAIGTGLGVLISPWFLLLSGFVGCGLVFAGVTNTCAMGQLLAKLPYNR
ncbi:MAG: rhodanese-like domain-containing protein [Pseudanabaena sp.]